MGWDHRAIKCYKTYDPPMSVQAGPEPWRTCLSAQEIHMSQLKLWKRLGTGRTLKKACLGKPFWSRKGVTDSSKGQAFAPNHHLYGGKVISNCRGAAKRIVPKIEVKTEDNKMTSLKYQRKLRTISKNIFQKLRWWKYFLRPKNLRESISHR